MKLVYVEWIDASGGSGWRDVNEAIEDAQVDNVRSVGFVLRDDDDALAIVQSVMERDDGTKMVNDWLTIPRENVERIVELGFDQ